MDTESRYNEFLQEIGQFVPADRIYTDELRRLAWGTDAGFYRLIPRIVVRSAHETEVSRLLQAAHRLGLPVTFRAAGTSLSGQSISDSILVIAGKNWESYTLSEDHTVISLQPGIIGERVNEILRPYGRKFAPDPASVKSAMVGGIVMNNASGMNCGTHANSDRMLLSVRIVLPDGTLLDTGNEKSRAEFLQKKPGFIGEILSLRDRIRENTALAERIRHKYSIKNVTGLNLLPFLLYDDPFDIITHLMVGSEGTLAFLSEVTMRTEHDYPYKASAMLYFTDLREACRAVQAMKQLKDNQGEWIVKGAELLDSKSLASVGDPVAVDFIKSASDHKPGSDGKAASDSKSASTEETKIVNRKSVNRKSPGLTAVLTETKADSREQLRSHIGAIRELLGNFDTYTPVTFTDKEEEYSAYWAIRSGIFPSVGGTRPSGTTCLIEDVAFPVEHLPEATAELQQLLARHGYDDACIYGHALEGNYHFILNQSFGTEAEVKRYEQLMEEVKTLVVDTYDGSLKAEHGTGRNMAPYVKYEWGAEAFEAMKAVKTLFDPQNLLNSGVIFNNDPTCHISHFKPLPLTNAKVDRCIECGFCEVNCLSCGFTLSSRQRIVVQREISRLRQEGSDPERLALLEKQYSYPGNQTCAGDGLCSTSCPMNINTGDLTHDLRQVQFPAGSTGYKVGDWTARHLSGVKSMLRPVLTLANTAHTVLGTSLMRGITRGLHKGLGLPQWTPYLPKAYHIPGKIRKQTVPGETPLKVVYFPSCINQTMGLARKSPEELPLVNKMISLLHKAGYEVIFPPQMDSLCCGTIWESKGMTDIADRKAAELEEALYQASGQGRYPVLCDQSPCLHRMRHTIGKMKLYEPAEFIYTFLRDKLEFIPIQHPVALHITYSMKKMGLAGTIQSLASLCSPRVIIPEEVGCCGFAGDKGFTHPELNRYALRKLKPQIEHHGIRTGYSNSRTCEIGLSEHTGIPYVSIVYLVDKCTRRKETTPETTKEHTLSLNTQQI
ncbi:MAG: FAD-binding oxidoreductase [Bacteroides sp.]|nr:FAD-binding oxidoreductase [Bacteroides sp.]